MSDFIERAKAFSKELSELEHKYCVSLGAGYSVPHDEENYLMVSDWKEGKTFIKLYELDDWEEDEDEE